MEYSSLVNLFKSKENLRDQIFASIDLFKNMMENHDFINYISKNSIKCFDILHNESLDTPFWLNIIYEYLIEMQSSDFTLLHSIKQLTNACACAKKLPTGKTICNTEGLKFHLSHQNIEYIKSISSLARKLVLYAYMISENSNSSSLNGSKLLFLLENTRNGENEISCLCIQALHLEVSFKESVKIMKILYNLLENFNPKWNSFKLEQNYYNDLVKDKEYCLNQIYIAKKYYMLEICKCTGHSNEDDLSLPVSFYAKDNIIIKQYYQLYEDYSEKLNAIDSKLDACLKSLSFFVLTFVNIFTLLSGSLEIKYNLSDSLRLKRFEYIQFIDVSSEDSEDYLIYNLLINLPWFELFDFHYLEHQILGSSCFLLFCTICSILSSELQDLICSQLFPTVYINYFDNIKNTSFGYLPGYQNNEIDIHSAFILIILHKSDLSFKKDFLIFNRVDDSHDTKDIPLWYKSLQTYLNKIKKNLESNLVTTNTKTSPIDRNEKNINKKFFFKGDQLNSVKSFLFENIYYVIKNFQDQGNIDDSTNGAKTIISK